MVESTYNFGMKKVSKKGKEDEDTCSGSIFGKFKTVIKSIQKLVLKFGYPNYNLCIAFYLHTEFGNYKGS